MTPTEIVLNAVAAIFTSFDPQAAEQLLAPDYIQHSVAVPTGAAPILGFIPALKDSGITVTTHRVIAERDLVVLHNTYDNAALLGRVDKRDSQSVTAVIQGWKLGASHDPRPDRHRSLGADRPVLAA